MNHYQENTAANLTASTPTVCPIKDFIQKTFGAVDSLATIIEDTAGNYRSSIYQPNLEHEAHVRNVHELVDWLRMSELNKLLGFENIVSRCPQKVVSVLSSFDCVLIWAEKHRPGKQLVRLRKLYRVVEARVWDINPLLMLRPS